MRVQPTHQSLNPAPGGREGGKGGREGREGGREEGREGDGGREEGREGREGGREVIVRGMEGGREGGRAVLVRGGAHLLMSCWCLLRTAASWPAISSARLSTSSLSSCR